MTTFTTRDATVTLRDQSDYTGWMLQLQARCVAHNIWDKINPKSTTQPLREPKDIRIPVFANYQAAAGIGEPERLSELSSSGQKAFKEDLEYYHNLMHNTLEEIATHVRTIELPTLEQQLETESFYKDSPPEEPLA
ncbi:hypothetical protein L13192_03825 [Pyrenophora tritici-repentis]|nr:hypothetical protein L13192_03825 [Pyrenophora tritici-repentis]